jgi:hypothetical protein
MTNSPINGDADRVLIIGTGLAGTIAYNALRSYSPICIDVRPPPIDRPLKVHPAVMRLRNSKVAELIGANYEEVKISKGIWDGKRLRTKADIRLNNLYSRKVYGALGRRSLNNMADDKRYILPDGYPPPKDTIWNSKVVELKDSEAIIRDYTIPKRAILKKYKHIISTVPMPAMINRIAGAPRDIKEVKFQYQPVYVLHVELSIDSKVHQTIYFPEAETDIYRITIQNKVVIIESMSPDTDDWVSLLRSSFGLSGSDFDPKYFSVDNNKWSKMPIGKISPIDEDARMRYIMWLTDEYNVFSFGRFAVWKPLRTDQLLGDIEKIRRIISASDNIGRYRSRL